MSSTTKKVYNMFERRQAIPIIYVRGTHYDVGYDVVRKWKCDRRQRRIIYRSEIICTSDSRLSRQT